MTTATDSYNFFVGLIPRAKPVKYLRQPVGIYIDAVEGHQPNSYLDLDELRRHLGTLVKTSKVYVLNKATFWRGQFNVSGKTIAIIWHKEKDGVQWIQILKNPKKPY